MIKKWDQFVNENKSTLEPIVIKSKKNDLFYIKIHFDKEGRVDKVENKWDVKIPEWYGFNVNEIEINNWIRRKEPELYIEKSVNESVNLSKQDIIEGNVIIADYLGLRYKNSDTYYIEEHEYPSADSFWENDTDCIYHKENLLYDYSWDWLEPVIDELEKKYSVEFERDDIKKTWLDVVNFIKQLNNKPTNEGKREKIFLNGYEMWLDRDKLMIYDKEDSKKGIGFDVAGEGDGIYIHSQHLTKDEKRQLTDYLKYGKK
ncbi:MAG: hypothetical protein WDA02_07490 [Saccharofermentanales bacterium]